MKSKTDFKQMYLVDATAYNGISRTDTPIILGRSNNKVSPPTTNVLAPVTSGAENPKTGYPINTEQKSDMKSVGTQSNVLNTKSTGVGTEPTPNKEHSDQASQTFNDRKLQTKYRSPRNNNRLPRYDNRSPRDNNRSEQPEDLQNTLQIENDPQISKKEIPSNTHLQYIVPDPEFQKAMNFTQQSASLPQPQTQPQLIDYNTIEYSTPLALPQPQQQLLNYNTNQHSAHLALPQPMDHNAIQYSAPLALPQPQQQLLNYKTNQHSAHLALPQPMDYNAIQYSAPLALPQPMDYSVNPQNNYTPQTQPQLMDHSSNTQTLSYPALPQPQSQPQLMDHSSNTQTPSYPQAQLMDYSVNPQNSALPAPVEDDCTECAVTKYKKYDVDLPSAQGLPEHSVFVCTLCQSNFSTKKSLQRHMKNIHDAFNQVEKGIKRKVKQGKISKKLKTSYEVVPYLFYGNPT